MSRNTLISNLASNEAIKRGLSKHYPGKTLMLNGIAWREKDIVAAFDAEEAQTKEVERLWIKWRGAVRTLRATVATNHQIRLNIKAAMRATHGAQSEVFAEFGFEAHTPHKPTLATTVAAIEKRAATRAARGTKGKRQRAKIKATSG